ncbi:MAG: hypothetical protein IT340_17160 [Chloroflexi bacterium]|nr:hypothetical protein [Chloroflexota bacterium]
MARLASADPIYAIAEQWQQACLLADGSLLWPGEAVWAVDTVRAFEACFVERFDDSADSFEVKFKRQLGDEPPVVTKLACELLLIYPWFAQILAGSRDSPTLGR